MDLVVEFYSKPSSMSTYPVYARVNQRGGLGGFRFLSTGGGPSTWDKKGLKKLAKR